MSKIERSVDVDVPVREAYDQWTQFEEFPRFMDGVERVQQLDDTHLHWVAQIAGQRKEWDAEITQQEPDQRVAWTATDGDWNAGVGRLPPGRRPDDARDAHDGHQAGGRRRDVSVTRSACRTGRSRATSIGSRSSSSRVAARRARGAARSSRPT